MKRSPVLKSSFIIRKSICLQMKQFLIDDRRASLQDALIANAEDHEVCLCLPTAKVGDNFHGNACCVLATRIEDSGDE